MERLVITAAEAAESLQLSKARMLEMLDHGEVPAYRDGTSWKIPIALLEKYVMDRAIREADERRVINEKVKME